MDKQQSVDMIKSFDSGDQELGASATNEFALRDDDRFKQEEDYRQELLKVQDEVTTLRQVLGAKLKRESELKTLLGVGFVDDLKQDWNETVHDLKATSAYQKTAETLQAATDKISPTLQTVNTSLKSRLGSLRNSTYFKTFENTLGSTVSAVKSKMTPSKSAMNFNGIDSNNDRSSQHGASRGLLPSSVTHDEHLHFAASPDEKKDLGSK